MPGAFHTEVIATATVLVVLICYCRKEKLLCARVYVNTGPRKR